jgi:predicted nucleotidyltransferase component of viral defense system
MISLVGSRPPEADGVNLMREYLQAVVLASLQDSKAFLPLAFHGGTCLRFLYRIARFSEDLDFALERPEAGFDFLSVIVRIERDLVAQGYEVRSTVNAETVVNKAFIGFVGAEYDAGLSPHRDKVFRVKIEVDTRPPEGAGLEVSSLSSFGFQLRLQHHDLPTLFAGKLAAVIARQYTKGRDLYDLLWYLQHPSRVEPNVTMLAHALRQTFTDQAAVDAAAWPGVVLEHLSKVAWADARADVERFLERPAEVELLEFATFERLLRRRIEDRAK